MLNENRTYFTSFRHQIRRLERLGYEIVVYGGFYGHNYYKRIPLLRERARAVARFLIAHPSPNLTTFAQLIMRKSS